MGKDVVRKKPVKKPVVQHEALKKKSIKKKITTGLSAMEKLPVEVLYDIFLSQSIRTWLDKTVSKGKATAPMAAREGEIA